MTKTVIRHIFHPIAACALACSGVKGHQEHSTVTQGIVKMRGAVFRMKTNSLKEKKRWGEEHSQKPTISPYKPTHPQALKNPQGEPRLLILPSSCGQAGLGKPQGIVSLVSWAASSATWLCLAGASPQPRAGHEVMDSAVSCRSPHHTPQELINTPLPSPTPPSTAQSAVLGVNCLIFKIQY